MTRIRAFFTPAKRKAIYATLAAVGLLVQTLGYADAVTVAHWLDVSSQVLAIGGLVMATLNTDTTTVNGMPAAEAPGAVAVVEPSSPTGAAAGMGSDLPDGAPVVVEEYEGRHAASVEVPADGQEYDVTAGGAQPLIARHFVDEPREDKPNPYWDGI